MTRLYDRQLTTASGGNISLRINADLFCITPLRGQRSAHLRGHRSNTIDGKNMTPHLRLSIETEMHASFSSPARLYGDVHAHPTYVSAFLPSEGWKVCNPLDRESSHILEDPVLSTTA